MPFAIESFGTFGQAAEDFVASIAEHASHGFTFWNKQQVLTGLINSVACAVQRGNAQAIRWGLQKCGAERLWRR